MATLTVEQQSNDRMSDATQGSLGDIVNLDFVWNIVKAGWYKLLFFTLIGWVVAGAYFVVAPPQFESETQLYVMLKDPELATRGETSGGNTGASVSDNMLATHIQIIQSRLIMSKVLEAGEPPIKRLASIRMAVDDDENPADYLIENLQVTKGGSGQARTASILNISLRHSDQEDCKKILEALLDEYVNYLNIKFQDVNKDAAVLIAQARLDLESELTAAETAYREFRENAPILWDEDEGSTNIYRMRYEAIQDELSELSLKQGDAETRLKVATTAFDKQQDSANIFDLLALIDEESAKRISMMLEIQKAKAETSEFAAMMPERGVNATNEYSQLMTLMMKQKDLSDKFGLGPNHPEIVSMREQISEAKKFLGEKSEILDKNVLEQGFDAQQVMGAYLKLLENDIVALKERKIQLEEQAEVEEDGAKTLVKYEMDGTALGKKIDRQQKLYDMVVDRLRDINLAQEYGGVINDVISPPETGEIVWPKLPTCLILGTLFGLTLGGASTLVSELRDRSFRDPEQVKEAMGVPLLSHLPQLNPKKDPKIAARIKETKSVVHPSIYVHHLPKSVNAEAFRALRTSIFFKRGSDQTVFSVTSANQGDGKSTTMANLAASIAQSGRRVLVVDCDMRRPSLHYLFGLMNESGFANVIGGEREPWDMIQETEIENLSVISAGIIPQNPAELLSSNKFRDVLSLFREKFDFVLLDSPPVLAVTDPAIVATAVDAALFLVNVGKDKRPEAVHAKEILDSVGAKVLGVMVVGGNTEAGNRYSGGYGRYGYQYGQMGSNQSYYGENSTEKSRS